LWHKKHTLLLLQKTNKFRCRNIAQMLGEHFFLFMVIIVSSMDKLCKWKGASFFTTTFFLNAYKTFKTPQGWGRDWYNTTLAMETLPLSNIWWMNILRILPSTKLNQHLLKVVWKEVERNPKTNIQMKMSMTTKLGLQESSSYTTQVHWLQFRLDLFFTTNWLHAIKPITWI
jgi:hypothetical protein